MHFLEAIRVVQSMEEVGNGWQSEIIVQFNDDHPPWESARIWQRLQQQYL